MGGGMRRKGRGKAGAERGGGGLRWRSTDGCLALCGHTIQSRHVSSGTDRSNDRYHRKHIFPAARALNARICMIVPKVSVSNAKGPLGSSAGGTPSASLRPSCSR